MARWTRQSVRHVPRVALAVLLAVLARGCDEDGPDELGKRCSTSDDCATGYCIPLEGEPLGGRSVCTKECAVTEECLAGWKCSPEPRAANLCKCQPSEERCDGLDNDCNGVIDDRPSAAEWCANNLGGLWACSDGRCACEPPRVSCPNGPTDWCADLQTDRNHCGACQARCGGTCVAGRCECPGGKVNCQGSCQDLNNDPSNCGACGVQCQPSQSCVGGNCVSPPCPGPEQEVCPPTDSQQRCRADGRCVAQDDIAPAGPIGEFVGAIAVGNTHVFFEERLTPGTFVDRRIKRVEKTMNGTTPEELVQLSAEYMPALATDGVDLFYGTRKVDSSQDVIVRCPEGTCGASAVQLASGTSATAIAVSGGFVYWLDGLTGEPKRCAVGGCSGTPSVLGAPPAGATIASGGDWESWIAVDATHVVVGYVGGGVIARFPVAGGSPDVLATTANGVSGLAISGATVWYADSTGIWRVPKAGGSPPAMLTAAFYPFSLAVTDKNVYWGQPIYWAFKCPQSGCAGPYALTSSGANVRVVAVDSTHLYYGGHTLRRVVN